MYHTKFRGTHYDIGHKYGSALRKSGKFILDNVPFPLGEEQTAFPIMNNIFRRSFRRSGGLADGQQCPAEKLQTVLFCMYCLAPACHCSHFAVRNKEHVLLGRNSDFLTSLEKLYTNNIYHLTGTSYSFTGNTTSFIQMEDGVNEQGLAIGLTMVQTHAVSPGLNAGMILRLLLEKCADVPEALTMIRELPTASGHTFVLADHHGNIALAECCPKSIEIVFPKEPEAFVCATNLFHTASMQKYNCTGLDNWQAEERYQTLLRTLADRYRTFHTEDAQALLSGQNGFLCQYDRKAGKDTVWSVVYEALERRLYRAEGNPARKMFREDTRPFT